MAQTLKDTESVKLNFSHPTLKRLERVDERALIKMLDEIDEAEVDKGMARQMAYLEEHEADATHTRPLAYFLAEMKKEGLS